jgi:predicted choloylglycine hydrolase
MVAAASAVAAAGWGSGGPLARESRAGEPAATDAVVPLSFEGTPNEIGIAYGKRFAEAVSRNMRVLLGERVPAQDPAFRAWVRSQEKLVEKHWPWYAEEMHGVAEAVNGKYEDALLLNLRAWQYAFYGAPPAQACSSLAIRLADGHMACAGALDDPIELYCGPVRFATRGSYRVLTFPITGTSWGNRGMNSEGLSVGISSQLLPGLRRRDHAVIQDIAMRAMLQTCASVAEVREFCHCHPFTMNLVCVDAAGGVFCAQHTAAGLREIKVQDACALTNHILEEDTEHWLRERGVQDFPRSPTTVPRRDKLLRFIASAKGKCTAGEVKALVARRDDADPASIHNSGSIYLTYACPQAAKTILWILQPKGPAGNDGFVPFAV